ncbi:hypothetical protein [Leptothoe spongobia]|uniref:Uncharacterized protein n=1 Tax=Leptothoe spongobia TAU-MAC 1115 TaxID=1967444 RepID=A0A947DHT3_9CYAN|nr:hypothetical protein [Leptothoe spongobia]MBT9316604.1 hypothetical protein [Leptothoe spongobia TAU-MAC 1115]
MSQFKTDYKQDKSDEGLRHVVQRLVRNIERDALVIETLDLLSSQLNIDRVALYYFYGQWISLIADTKRVQAFLPELF